MPVDISKEEAVETYKSLIQLLVEGMKFLALLNGGASVAILSYLGSVASKGRAIPDMRWAMAAFLGGLVFCALFVLSGYLTQLRVYEEAIGEGPTFGSAHWSFWMRMALICALASIVCFILGSFFAVWRFN